MSRRCGGRAADEGSSTFCWSRRGAAMEHGVMRAVGILALGRLRGRAVGAGRDRGQPALSDARGTPCRGLAGLGNPGRDATERPQELVDAWRSGGNDGGGHRQGVGYLLPYLSRAVGPAGHVEAEDISTIPERGAAACRAGETGQRNFHQGHRDRPEAGQAKCGRRTGARFVSSLQLSGEDAGGVP